MALTAAPYSTTSPVTTTDISCIKGLKSRCGMFYQGFHSKSLQTVDAQRAAIQSRNNGNFKITLDIRETEGYNLNAVVYAGDASSIWMNGDSESINRLSAGEYTVVAIFAPDTQGKPMKVIMKENVEVNGDITLVIDPATATERISFEAFTPDGKAIIGPKINEQGEIIENGSVYSADAYSGYMITNLAHKRLGLILYYEGIFLRMEMADGTVTDYSDENDFLVNPGVSKDFFTTMTCIENSADGDTAMLIKAESDGVYAQTVTNSASDFATCTYDQIFTESYYPSDVTIVERDMVFGYTTVWYGNPVFQMEAGGSLFADAKTLAYCLPDQSGISRPDYAILPYVTPSLFAEPQDVGDGVITQDVYQIWPSPINQVGNKMHSTNVPVLNGYYGFPCNTAEGMSADLVLNGAPSFSYELGATPQKAGDSTPIIQIIDTGTKDKLEFYYCTTGRLGEGPVNLGDIASVSYGDKKLTADRYDPKQNDIFYGFIETFNEELDEFRGKFKLAITADQCLKIDNIPAYSYSEAEWNYEQREDNWIPRMTMLQFRNKEGIITDRFDKADDGVVTFSCGDFNSITNPVYQNSQLIGYETYFDFISTPDIKVEYSPLQRDDWQQIEVNEDKSKFYMPGYGAFISGSLAGVDRGTPYGWFDLRVTLTDNYGNTFRSTISPAFRIDNLVSLESIRDTGTSVRLSVENGRVVASDGSKVNIYNIAGSEIPNVSLTAGIYVAVTSSAVTKIVVR